MLIFFKRITYLQKWLKFKKISASQKKKSCMQKLSIVRKVHISRITCEKSQTLLILGKIIMYLHNKIANLNISSNCTSYISILCLKFCQIFEEIVSYISKNLLWKIRYFNNQQQKKKMRVLLICTKMCTMYFLSIM